MLVGWSLGRWVKGACRIYNQFQSPKRRHIKLFWAKITNSTTNVTQQPQPSLPMSFLPSLSASLWLVQNTKYRSYSFLICPSIPSFLLLSAVQKYIQNTASVHVGHLYPYTSTPTVVGVYHKCFEPLKCSSEASGSSPSFFSLNVDECVRISVCVCVCVSVCDYEAHGQRLEQQQSTKFNANSKNNESICFAKHKNMSK